MLTFLGIENKTIGFHYPTQRWLSYYSFIPENYISAGVTNYYWEGGKMYRMNKGERKPITYQFTSNGNPSIPKKFRSIEIVGDLVNFNMNCTIPSGSNYRDMYTRSSRITDKENKKYIELPRNMKTSSNTPSVAEKDSGIEMRGQFANFEVTGNLKLTTINVNNLHHNRLHRHRMMQGLNYRLSNRHSHKMLSSLSYRVPPNIWLIYYLDFINRIFILPVI